MRCPDHYRNLHFPLNAYAVALWLNEARVDSLHYGFDPEHGGIFAAQARATEFLLQRLAPPPARVLEVGIGLGQTAERLRARGYDYTGVTPDAQQIAFCASRSPGLRLLESKFEDLSLPNECFDAVIFQESSQYMSTRALLRQASALLTLGGQLVIMDEVESGQIHALLQLASEQGFKLVQQQDVTPRAAPSLDYLFTLISSLRARLLAELGTSERAMDTLLFELEKRRAAYRAGTYAYQFFSLERSS